jgi:hypothetical protein
MKEKIQENIFDEEFILQKTARHRHTDPLNLRLPAAFLSESIANYCAKLSGAGIVCTSLYIVIIQNLMRQSLAPFILHFTNVHKHVD